MSMTRKHYQEVARILRYAENRTEIARCLADMFGADNPRFDKERFVSAVGTRDEAGSISQHLRAPNDPNGNPRRVYVIYSTSTGDVLSVWDEGYRGQPAEIRNLPALPEMTITATEYRQWINVARKNGTLHSA